MNMMAILITINAYFYGFLMMIEGVKRFFSYLKSEFNGEIFLKIAVLSFNYD
ncbi:hypothetical protein yfred0001_12030 [Yersinia frederiksenii ATCC 33641]|nr:hypothetical protein yfred0001_12030 [Yersinia frederiksenii ATCC 33641]